MEPTDTPFAAAVQAVIGQLEATGYEIAEASFHAPTTPHIVAASDDELVFVIVQGLEGPHLAEFGEGIYHSQMRPLVEAVTWHPKGSAVAQLAASHGGRAMLAIVGLLATDDIGDYGEPRYMAKVFPFRSIDISGQIGAAGHET